MKCKQCNTALTGRQREFCSDKCRMKHNRQSKANEDSSQSTKANEVVVEHPLESEQVEPEQRKRTLVEACKEHPCRLREHVRHPADDRPLPGGPGTEAFLRGVHPTDLQLRLKSYPGDSWVNSPEHKEVLRRRRCWKQKETT